MSTDWSYCTYLLTVVDSVPELRRRLKHSKKHILFICCVVLCMSSLVNQFVNIKGNYRSINPHSIFQSNHRCQNLKRIPYQKTMSFGIISTIRKRQTYLANFLPASNEFHLPMSEMFHIFCQESRIIIIMIIKRNLRLKPSRFKWKRRKNMGNK